MAGRTGTARALDGMVVIELGEGVAPAFCGRWLAAFGAEVIKVEPPAGDWTRRYLPYELPRIPPGHGPATQDGTDSPPPSPLFDYLNAGKRSVTLDPEPAAGRVTLRRLVARADVLVHGLGPEQRRSLGLDGGSLHEAYPALVEVALSPFGDDGPYRDFAAAGIVLLALGGYQFLTGEPGRAPLALPGFQPEYLTGLFGTVAALAGIIARGTDGRGRRLGLTTLEVMASLHQFTVSQYLTQGTIRSRHGNRWENLYPITLLPCGDGHVGLAVTTQDQWERLCAMLGRPELIDDPRFATGPLRREHADELDAILVAWLQRQGKREFFHRAQEDWRLPVGPLYDLREVLDDPQYRARGFWVEVEGTTPGVLHPGLPATMSATPWSLTRAPRLGEHDGQSAAGSRQSEPDEPSGLQGSAGTKAGAKAGEPEAISRPRSSPLPGRPGLGPTGSPDSPLPLAGVRVLDFTRVWSGPLCTRILADLGAEVIKIEAPQAAAPSVAGNTARTGAGFGKLNRNKLGVAIDLRLPAGRDLVRRLVAKSDVLVENFSARVMPNFGLGYEQLRALNPGLVMLAMPGFGAVGPYHNYMAYGPAIEPMTGLSSLIGYPGEPALVSAIAYPDAVAGVTAACAVLTALAHQRRTGAGQFIDLSQLEATTNLIGEYLLAYQLAGAPPPRAGNGHPVWAPHGTYRCRGEDEWVSLAVRSDDEWRRLCAAMGLEALGRDPAYAGAAGRRGDRERLDAAIEAWTRGRDKFEVMETLQAAGVPAGAVLNAPELLENPQLVHRGFWVRAGAGSETSLPMPGTPVTVDGHRRREWHPAPAPGEHNRRVLSEILALPPAEVAALEAAGVLAGGAPVG